LIHAVVASPFSRRTIPSSPLRKASGPFMDKLVGMGVSCVSLSPLKTKVAANCNVFVSPMRTPVELSAGYPAMTPRTTSLYCMGDTSPMFLAKALADVGEASVAGAMECQQPGSDASTDQGRSEDSSEASGGDSM